MALEAALRVPGKIRGLFLVEPVAFHYLRASEETLPHWQRIVDLGDAIQVADAGGDGALAARHFMGFWVGERMWALAPEKQQLDVAATMSKVASEFRQVFGCDSDPSVLERLTFPVTLVSGTRTPAPAEAVSRIIASHLPNGHWERIDGAGHMIPLTHRDLLMGLLQAHLERC